MIKAILDQRSRPLPLRLLNTVLRIGSLSFHFYSDEGNKPPHIHVATAEGECKFWLEPINLARNKGIDPKTVPRIEILVFEHYALLKEKYETQLKP